MFHASKILSVSASRHTTSSAYHICKILSSKNMLFFAAFCRKTDGHEYQRDYRNFMLAKIRSIRTSGKCTSKNSCKPLVAAMPSIRCDQRNTAPTVITASNPLKATSSHIRIIPKRNMQIPFSNPRIERFIPENAECSPEIRIEQADSTVQIKRHTAVIPGARAYNHLLPP